MNRNEAVALTKKIGEELSASSFDCGSLVIISHRDGTVLNFAWAFIRECQDWVLVFTEHHGYHVFPKDDLNTWRQYKSVPVDSVDTTGKIVHTHCTICESRLESPREVWNLVDKTVCGDCCKEYGTGYKE